MSYHGQKRPIAPQRQADAKEWDTNKDGYLSEREILKGNGVDFRKKETAGEDRPGLVHETKCWLAGEPNEYRDSYHSYAEVGKELKSLEKKYPKLAKRVSLGKSVEGREIWALRLREKPGQDKVVITGLHHAREWMTVEIPLGMAKEFCERPEGLNGKEVWLVPLVNPDGYEYSRETDNMWRKNRQPLESGEVGVDLNRNYWDGKEATRHIYRPKGDRPNTTKDDFEEGNDDPKAENYRGPKGGSEPETQALMKLKLDSVGSLDFHSYGQMILHPPGHTFKRQKGEAAMARIGEAMNQAAGGELKVSRGTGLYPTSGSPDDLLFHYGIPSFTFEVNGCFQPHPSLIEPTVEKMNKAAVAFLKEV